MLLKVRETFLFLKYTLPMHQPEKGQMQIIFSIEYFLAFFHYKIDKNPCVLYTFLTYA